MAKTARAMSKSGNIFCAAIDNLDVVKKIQSVWKPSPVGLIALGRLAAGTSLIGSLLKNDDDRLTIHLNGKGVGGSLVAVSDHLGNIKCRCENPNAVPKDNPLSVADFVGKDGNITVIKELGLNIRKELPYTTSVQLISGEIAQDISVYFVQSEQIPTACNLGVLLEERNNKIEVVAAGGYFLQMLPPATLEATERIEENIRNAEKITVMLKSKMTAEEIALKMLEGLEPEILDVFDSKYRCDCSRNKTLDMLSSMPLSDLETMTDDKTEIHCNFCDNKFLITKKEIEEIISFRKS